MEPSKYHNLFKGGPMAHKSCFALFLSVICFLIIPTVQAKSFYVGLAVSSGVDTSVADTVTELIKTAVVSMGHDLAEDPKEADYSLQPKLLKLGSAIVLTIDKTRKGRVIHSGNLKAAAVEELDVVATRLTRAVVKGQKVAKAMRVGRIRESEVDTGRRRTKAAKRKYLGFGPSLVSSLGTGDVFYDFVFAYSWDINKARLSLFLDLAVGETESVFFMGGLGVKFFTSMEDTSPFFGGEFGFGAFKPAGAITASQGGFAAGATAGYSFFRTSSINLDVALKIAAIMKESSAGGIPILGGLRVGMHF